MDLNSDVSESRAPHFTPSPAILPTHLFFRFHGHSGVSCGVQLFQVHGGGSGSTGLPRMTMTLINGLSSFSATECHLSLAEGKSAVSSDERLLLIGHHNHICPKVNFHSATFLVTTSDNVSADVQSHWSPIQHCPHSSCLAS